MKEKGYIQIYTGNGKGKTTCSFGLTVRALGAGYNVFIGQFMKGSDYSELNFWRKMEGVELIQFGMPGFIMGKPTDEDIEQAKKGFALCREKMLSGEFDVIVMDEINVAVKINMISEDDVIALMNEKPEHVELIMTGRGATEKMIERADLVTEMTEIKHYYKAGVNARVGIEK